MDLLGVHRSELERWRHITNLVGPGPLEPHYEDAQQALAGLSLEGHWADLGSGAGFPGIVLAALAPEATVDLVDSRRKRCSFLLSVVARMPARAAPLRVLHTRIEALPDHSYDGLTARALARPPIVARYAARLLRPGGQLLLFLAQHSEPPEHPALECTALRPYRTSTHQRKLAVLRRRHS